jgi:cyanophycinase
MGRPAKKRILIPIGGNELKSLDSEIFRHMVRLAGGSRARIVVIPTASAIPEERARVYTEFFRTFDPASLDVLMIDRRSEAADPAVLKAVESCTAVMFAGGDQLRLSSILGGTPLHQTLLEKYHDGCIVAGTSAGAAAMSEIMIYQNNHFRSQRKGGLEITQGLGFIKGVVLDTHFVQRSRISRLVHAVATNPGLLGIGIEENTALLIENERRAMCLGTGTVILVDGRDAELNDIGEVGNGHPFTITGLLYSVVTQGRGFDLVDRHAYTSETEPGHMVVLQPVSNQDR